MVVDMNGMSHRAKGMPGAGRFDGGGDGSDASDILPPAPKPHDAGGKHMPAGEASRADARRETAEGIADNLIRMLPGYCRPEDRVHVTGSNGDVIEVRVADDMYMAVSVEDPDKDSTTMVVSYLQRPVDGRYGDDSDWMEGWGPETVTASSAEDAARVLGGRYRDLEAVAFNRRRA